jgi:hypothetical protein
MVAPITAAVARGMLIGVGPGLLGAINVMAERVA